MYANEKANTELLVQKHAEEMKEKDALIETMKARIQEIPSTWDMKVRALEVRVNCSCIPDEKIQVKQRFWSGSEILF